MTDGDDAGTISGTSGIDAVATSSTELLRETARSGMWSVLAYAAGAGSAFVISVIVGRALGPSSLGRYSFGMWVLRVPPTVVALGVPLALAKVVPEKLAAGYPEQARATYAFVLRAHLLLFGPITIAAVVAAAILGREPMFVAVLVGGGLVVLLALDVEGMLAGLRRFRGLSILTTVTGIAQVIGAAIGVQLGLDWLGLLAVFVSIGVASLAGMAAFTTRATAALPHGHVPRSELRAFVRFAGIAGATVVVEVLLWGRLELLFLGWFRDADELGFYSASLRIASIAAVLPTVAGRPLLPEFARLRGAGTIAELQALFERACALLAAVAAPVAIIGAALAPSAVRVVYGRDFSGADKATVILTATSFLLAVGGPLGTALLTGPRPRVVVQLGAFSVAANVILDLAIIPHFGMTGAAVANGLAQLSWVVVALRLVRTNAGLRYPVGPAARCLAAAGVAALVAVSLDQVLADLPTVILGGAAALVVYAVCARLLGVLDRGQLEVLGIGRRRRPMPPPQD